MATRVICSVFALYYVNKRRSETCCIPAKVRYFRNPATRPACPCVNRRGSVAEWKWRSGSGRVLRHL
ncbi:hypothetical protein J6590_007383, partial [Homalodisca vitripennis]